MDYHWLIISVSHFTMDIFNNEQRPSYDIIWDCVHVLSYIMVNNKNLWGVFRNLSNLKMELFTNIVNGFQQLTFFTKNPILDVWEGPEYTSEVLVVLHDVTEHMDTVSHYVIVWPLLTVEYIHCQTADIDY